MRQVRDERTRYIITYRGQPMGVILPLEESILEEQLLPDTLLSDPWEELIELGQKISQDWQTGQTGAEILSKMRR